MQDKILLGYLMLRPCTAYEIKKAMEKSTEFFFTSSLGSIIPAFKKLEKKNLVSVLESVENGRAKKTYHITSQGQSEFLDWMKSEISLGKVKDEALIRMFFFGLLEPNNRVLVIKEYIKEMVEIIEKLKQIEKESSSKEIPNQFKEIAKYQMDTINFGKDYYAYLIQWFTNYINSIKG